MTKFHKRYFLMALLQVVTLASYNSYAQTTDPQQPTTIADDSVSIQNLDDSEQPAGNLVDDMVFMPEPIQEPIFEEIKTITTVRALDKITAHITELELPVGEVVSFGTLRITARTCSSRPPEEIPETFAFLEIDDMLRNDELVRVFTGWMMASSPALNGLEHSVYDVWVISCKIVEGDVSSDNE